MRVIVLRREGVGLVTFIVALSIVLVYKLTAAGDRFHVVHYVIKVPETVEFKSMATEANIKDMSSSDIRENNLTNYKFFILSFGGMELTILLDNLNNFYDIIYWHEPMTIWKRIHRNYRRTKLSILDDDPLNDFVYKDAPSNFTAKMSAEEYGMYENSAAFYTEILSCKFTQRIERYLVYAAYYCPELVLPSKSISDLLGCTNKNQKIICDKTTDITKRLNQLCARRRSNVVVKERQEYLQSFEAIHSSLDESITDSLNVLQVVRDPRAVLFDITRHGLIARNIYRADFQSQTHFVCERLAKDLTFGRKSLKRYQLRRYEDIARMFETKIFRDVLQLKLDFRTNVRRNVELRERIQNYDNTTLEMDWWRREIPIEISSAMENLCWKSIQDLGYMFVGYERDLLRGNKTLIEDSN